jgi:hypothetical protein
MPIKRAFGKKNETVSLPNSTLPTSRTVEKPFNGGDGIKVKDLQVNPGPLTQFKSDELTGLNALSQDDNARKSPSQIGNEFLKRTENERGIRNFSLSPVQLTPKPSYITADTIEEVPTNVVSLMGFNRVYEDSSTPVPTQFGKQLNASITAHSINIKDVSYVVSEASKASVSPELLNSRRIVDLDSRETAPNLLNLLTQLQLSMESAENALNISADFSDVMHQKYDEMKWYYEPSLKSSNLTITNILTTNADGETTEQVYNMNNLQLVSELMGLIDSCIDGSVDPVTEDIISYLRSAVSSAGEDLSVDTVESLPSSFVSRLRDALTAYDNNGGKKLSACVRALSRIFTFSSPESSTRPRESGALAAIRRPQIIPAVSITSAASQTGRIVSFNDTSAPDGQRVITPVEPENQVLNSGAITLSGPRGLIRNPIARRDFSCLPYNSYTGEITSVSRELENFSNQKLRLYTDAVSPVRILEIIINRFIEALDEAEQDETDRVQLVALQEAYANRTADKNGRSLSAENKKVLTGHITAVACSVQSTRNKSSSPADDIKTDEIKNIFGILSVQETTTERDENLILPDTITTTTTRTYAIDKILELSSDKISDCVWRARGYRSSKSKVSDTNNAEVGEYISEAITTSVNNRGRTVFGKIASAYRDIYTAARDAFGGDRFTMTTSGGRTVEGRLDEFAIMTLITECFTILAGDLRLGLTETYTIEEQDDTSVGAGVGSVIGLIVGAAAGPLGAVGGAAVGGAVGSAVGLVTEYVLDGDENARAEQNQKGLRKISSLKASLEKFDTIAEYDQIKSINVADVDGVEGRIKQAQLELIDFSLRPKLALAVVEGFSISLAASYQHLVSSIGTVLTSPGGDRISANPAVLADISQQQIILRRALLRSYSPTQFEQGMLPQRIASTQGEINAMLAMLNDQMFSSSRSDNIRLMCIAMPVGTDSPRKPGKFDLNYLSRTGTYRLNVHFKDLELDDIVFKPRGFRFDPALFITPDSFSKITGTERTLNDVLEKVDFFLASTSRFSVGSSVTLSLNQLRTNARYSGNLVQTGLAANDVDEIAMNTLVSYLLGTYTFLTTGILLDETVTVTNDAGLSKIGNQIISEISAARLQNLVVPGFASISRRSSRSDVELLGAISRSYLFRKNRLSDIIASRFDFDRSFIVPVDPDSFEIDESATNSTTMGRILLKDIRDSGWTFSSRLKIISRSSGNGGFIAGQLSSQFMEITVGDTAGQETNSDDNGRTGRRSEGSTSRTNKSGKRPPFSLLKFGKSKSFDMNAGDGINLAGKLAGKRKFGTKKLKIKPFESSTTLKKTIPTLDRGEDDSRDTAAKVSISSSRIGIKAGRRLKK